MRTKEQCIRTSQTLGNEIESRMGEFVIRRERWYKRLLDKKHRKRTIRSSLLVANALVLVSVIAFVAQKPETAKQSTPLLSAQSTDSTFANPLDDLSSADIAVNISRATRLPESTSVTNLADTVSAQLAVSSSDKLISSKPQVIATGLPSRADIKTYTTQKGDTVSSIAAKFDVTSETIRWSNDLASNTVAVGTKLVISPVDGIIYTVARGDTIAGLASRYQVGAEKLTAINDLESGKMPVGQKIIIPGGVKPAVGTAAVTTSQTTATSYNAYAGLAFGTSPVYGYNGYDPGWCTWYAASRVSVPNNWGNANTWDDGALASGWSVSRVPKVGAVAQSNVGWAGHVGVVEAVSKDGKMIKYSDMNGLAGFGRVGSSGWVPANAKYQNFIYR